MIVGVCGLGYTGSGALTDLLKEFKGISYLNEIEFTIAYMPDGLEELEWGLMLNHSRYMTSDAVLYRFERLMRSLYTPQSVYRKKMGKKYLALVSSYIDDLTDVKWKGFWGFDNHISSPFKKTIDFRIIINSGII